MYEVILLCQAGSNTSYTTDFYWLITFDGNQHRLHVTIGHGNHRLLLSANFNDPFLCDPRIAGVVRYGASRDNVAQALNLDTPTSPLALHFSLLSVEAFTTYWYPECWHTVSPMLHFGMSGWRNVSPISRYGQNLTLNTDAPNQLLVTRPWF